MNVILTIIIHILKKNGYPCSANPIAFMTFKERYRRFKQWQVQPLEYHESQERHTCNNCGMTFTGNHCPTCGQKATMGAVTWDSIREGVMDLWSMGTRSLSYTLLQLFLRPGYLIGDYISGRRQVSFPPVKMLVLVGLAVFLIGQVGGVELFGSDTFSGASEDEHSPLNQLFSWLTKHYDWASLFLFLAFALPTYQMFRYAPRHPYHTIPQEFFIQVFNSTQFLCLSLIWNIILKLFNVKDPDMDLTMTFLFPLLIFYNYKQLFGYGYWGTFWRIICCYWLWMVLLFAFMNIDECIIHIRKYSSISQAKEGFTTLVMTITMLALSSFIFYIFNTWYKPLQKKGKKKTIMGNITLIMTAILSLILVNSAFQCLIKWIATNRHITAIATIFFFILIIIVNYYLYSYTKKRSSSFYTEAKKE